MSWGTGLGGPSNIPKNGAQIASYWGEKSGRVTTGQVTKAPLTDPWLAPAVLVINIGQTFRVRRAQRTGTANGTAPVPKVESLSIDLPLLVTLRWKSGLAPARGGDYGRLDSRAKNVLLLPDTSLRRSPQPHSVAFEIAGGGT